MSALKPASQSYAEQFLPESELQAAARERGEQLGCTPVGPGVGAALRLLAATNSARHVVEIGTGAGVSGLWLLDGMPDDGILTTIDLKAEHQRVAKQAYAAAGVPAARTRTITGNALEVLPRLADGAYDLVLVDGAKDQYPAYLEHALRIVRPGGVVAIDNMLWHDKVADPAARDETTVLLRNLSKELRDREDLVTALLPVGDGLLVCVKRP